MIERLNSVILGDYQGKAVVETGFYKRNLAISQGWFSPKIALNNSTVKSYKKIYGERDYNDDFAIKACGVLAAACFGALGGLINSVADMAAKSEVNIFLLLVEFKNGKKSIVRLEERCYITFIDTCY